MRRFALAIAIVAMLVGMMGIQPASATHNCTSADCIPVTIALLQGQGRVCAASGLGNCSYHYDAFWPNNGTNTLTPAQGLYCPTRGPGAGKRVGSINSEAPFRFTAGPGIGVLNACLSNVGGSNCAFVSQGNLAPGVQSNLGAYAFSSSGQGMSTFTAPAFGVQGSVETIATFGWEQSAATILPLRGQTTSTKINGVTQNRPPATVIGFTSSRSFQDGGNCGISAGQPTTIFQVEGMVVTF